MSFFIDPGKNLMILTSVHSVKSEYKKLSIFVKKMSPANIIISKLRLN